MGWFVPRFGRRTLPPESLAPPVDDDLALLDELRAEGSKLHLPHPVRVFVRFDTETDARGAMELMDKAGYRSFLRTEAERRWTVTATQSTIPTPGAITKMPASLTALAGPLRGEHLGVPAA